MAKVRMLTSVAGGDTTWSAGQVVDMTEEQAAVWADGERAERVDGERAERVDDRPAETTTERAPEDAADHGVIETQMTGPSETRAPRGRRRPR